MRVLPTRTAPWRLPLHIPVAVLFSLLILGVGAAISAHHFHATHRLLEAANTALFEALADKARQTLEDADRAVRRSFILLAASPLADAGHYAERLRYLPELTGLLEADPLIESVMVGYGNGDFFLVRRAEAGDAAAWSVLDISTVPGIDDAPAPVLSRFDAGLRLIDARVQPGEAYEPRLATWYRLAAASDALTIAPARALPFSTRRGISFARRNGAEVIAVNIGFDRLSRFLAGHGATPGTRLQVLGPDRSVLAGDATTHAGSAPIQQALAGYAGAALHTTLPDGGGRPWRIAIAPLRGFGDADWALAVATPDDEVFAEAYRQRQTSLLFTVLAVLASFPLAWALSRLLTTPLHRLAHMARTLSALQFKPQPATHSVILEVDQLAATMTMMRTAIARFLEMGRDLGAARDVDGVLREVGTSAREISGASWCGIELAHDELRPARPDSAAPPTDDLPDAEGPFSVLDRPARQPDRHLLGVPLRTPDGERLGTLLLADRRAVGSPLARAEVAGFLLALAGTAAVALENQRLLKGRKALLKGVISMVAEAIDAKSPYTGGHCRRVATVAQRLARAAHETETGPLAGYRLDASGWEALEIASWLHDCGKLTTPEYVIDKATKLETLHNRIHEIRTRFEVLKRDAEITYWRGLAGGGDEAALRHARDAAWRELDDDFAFVARCNLGSEGMAVADVARLEGIAARRWVRSLDDRLGLSNAEQARRQGLPPTPLPAGETLLADKPEMIIPRHDSELFAPGNPWGFTLTAPEHLYNHGELHNLRQARGTLNDEERFKIKEHIAQTIIMLARLPFPHDLAAVPEMASAHHEALDGSGYPRGLHAGQMSVTARIMAIADIFEALTAADRPYRSANTVAEALAIMGELCGRRVIDADLFALFVDKQLWREEAPSSTRHTSFIDPA